jgi:hypothetical protein
MGLLSGPSALAREDCHVVQGCRKMAERERYRVVSPASRMRNGPELKSRAADRGGDDSYLERQMIGVAIGRIAAELGDQAKAKSSISRAMNLYQAADVHITGFVNLLYHARGEVKDRWQFPGSAPQPRNRMAYFFAVVEDRLGLRDRTD